MISTMTKIKSPQAVKRKAKAKAKVKATTALAGAVAAEVLSEGADAAAPPNTHSSAGVPSGECAPSSAGVPSGEVIGDGRVQGSPPSGGFPKDGRVRGSPPSGGFLKSCLKGIHGTLVRTGAMVAACISAPNYVPQPMKHVSWQDSTPQQRTFLLDYVDDTGAGRTICSEDALTEQGVPKDLIRAYTGKASTPMVFTTGGGEVSAAKSIVLSGGTPGLTEAYNLPGSPYAVCCGEIVNHKRQPFIWITGHLPFHVTDYTKLKVTCPMKYRRYAHHLDNNVPIFRERITVGGRNKNSRATLRAFSAPAPVAVPDSDEEASSRRIPPSAEEVAAIGEVEAILGDVDLQLAEREERRVAMADDLDLPYTPTLQSDQSSEEHMTPRERVLRSRLGSPDEPPDPSSPNKSSSSSDSSRTRASSRSRSSSPSFDPPPEFSDEEVPAPVADAPIEPIEDQGRASSDPPVDPEALGLHEIMQVPDVPFDDSGFQRKRSMSKRALLIEAESSLHQASHFPHNPFCEICGLSHMRAASFHRSVPADRSDQFAPTGPNQMYSADTLIISRSKVSADPSVPIPAKVSGEGHSNSFGIRDCYSGCGLMFPQLVRTTLGNIHSFKHFHGPRGGRIYMSL